MLCRTEKEQISLGFDEERQETLKKVKGSYGFTFGMVDSKLIWLEFESKLIQYVEIDSLFRENEAGICWTLKLIHGFTVRDLLTGFSQEDYRTEGVSIDEISEESILRKKSQFKNLNNNGKCLM